MICFQCSNLSASRKAARHYVLCARSNSLCKWIVPYSRYQIQLSQAISLLSAQFSFNRKRKSQCQLSVQNRLDFNSPSFFALSLERHQRRIFMILSSISIEFKERMCSYMQNISPFSWGDQFYGRRHSRSEFREFL